MGTAWGRVACALQIMASVACGAADDGAAQGAPGEASPQDAAAAPAPTSAAAGPDAAAPTVDASPLDGSAGAACTDLAQLGSSMTATVTKDPAPAPLGGAIAPGTYVRMKTTVHGSSLPAGSTVPVPARETWRVGASAFEGVLTDTKAERRESGSYVVSGTTMVLTRTCSTDYKGGLKPPKLAFPYTATATDLTIIVTAGNATYVYVYARQ